jgi:hypothetical protein
MEDVIGNESPFDLLRRALDEDGWSMEMLADGRTVRGVFDGRHSLFWVYATIPADLDVLVCHGRCPFDVPPELRPAAAELVARLNLGFRVGNLELDLDNGELRFKSSLHFRGVRLDKVLILNVLLPCAYQLDRVLPALDILARGASVYSALAVLD